MCFIFNYEFHNELVAGWLALWSKLLYQFMYYKTKSICGKNEAQTDVHLCVPLFF